MFDNQDGSNCYECFCELHDEDRNPNRKGPNRYTIITSSNTTTTTGMVDHHCNDLFLNMAAANEYEVFLDAVVDDETDVLQVQSWSNMTVSKSYTL